MMVQGLMLGQVYWILTDLEHGYVLGQKEYEACKCCVLQHYITVDHDSIKYCFHTYNDEYGERYALYDWECDQLVFLSIDGYLHYLVRHVDNLNTNINQNKLLHRFDSFLKCKIAESQEKHPEIWI